MNALEVIQRFIDAFNRHDADAVNALYAEGATYHSPRFDHPVKEMVCGPIQKMAPKKSYLQARSEFPSHYRYA